MQTNQFNVMTTRWGESRVAEVSVISVERCREQCKSFCSMRDSRQEANVHPNDMVVMASSSCRPTHLPLESRPHAERPGVQTAPSEIELRVGEIVRRHHASWRNWPQGSEDVAVSRRRVVAWCRWSCLRLWEDCDVAAAPATAVRERYVSTIHLRQQSY